MGNFCCNDEVTKGKKAEEYHFEIEKVKSYAQKNNYLLQPHLETVKEEPYECSEQSEYRSVSRASRH
ncbi:hypothetical protein SteCoe_5706 [Stentor coeruleus]|jgi:hypothetical protein|uniref:Uncharacterized protein n=1 Tax=Stentor coeruleus TaxID=5963 RepID=A0A1R2CRP9_9CILI|nr:hypothetical protein SteCoe_5706 [Stentor coeruleus]